MKSVANAQFAIKSWDETPFDVRETLPRMTRASVVKAFTGDLEAESHVEYVMAYTVDGSATFVGMERITGRLAGKAGSFVMQRTGTFENAVALEQYAVIAGSATGELVGLRGRGTSAVGEGMEHPFLLNYEFDPPHLESETAVSLPD